MDKKSLIPDINGEVSTHTWCEKCVSEGKTKTNCPVIEKVTMTSSKSNVTIPESWLLLDTASTISLLSNVQY